MVYVALAVSIVAAIQTVITFTFVAKSKNKGIRKAKKKVTQIENQGR